MEQGKLDRLLNTALWWKQIRETNNTAFLPLFFDQHRYLVLKGGGGSGKSIATASLLLGLMILPTITSLSIDAITAVPKSYREGSYGVGASRWQTIWHVVLKSATPSLMTAVILGMTRAFGETLAVRMVIGGVEAMPEGLLDSASTITTTLTTSMAVYATGSVQNDVLWSLGLLLMGMSLIFILIIHLIGAKGAKARG